MTGDLFDIFMPEATRQVKRIRNDGTRFVHYTSAESGLKILRSGRMLLRNSTLMNDFSEVQHGIECLCAAYKSEVGERLRVLMRAVQVDLPSTVEATFNRQIPTVRNETYLLSISEHGDSERGDQIEDAYGRLSMWRAYASRNGIAFVLNNAPFVTASNALNAFTSPVVYADRSTFLTYFEDLVAGLENNIHLISSFGGEFAQRMLIDAFRFAIQSTKHPSFREEREWRIIYSPTLLEQAGQLTLTQMARVPTEIMSLNGVPQRTYAIPFQDYPDEGFVGATIPALLDRILIGPSVDAYAIGQAFIAELHRCGIVDAPKKVIFTGVPLRV